MLNITLALSTFMAKATIIDGINYTFDEKGKTATVIRGLETGFFIDGNIVIPESVSFNGKTYRVASIGSEAFAYYGLTSVSIPNTVNTIGDYAFSGCVDLNKVTIPNSVTTIGIYAFSGCTGLTTVAFNAENCVKMGDSTKRVFDGCTGLTTLTIGKEVATIPEYAFCGCIGLTSVVIPNSVTSICDGAFWGCKGLASITIPNSVTSISYNAFSDCTGLTSAVIPNSVITIGANAFHNCYGLTSIVIPNSVTSIGYGAFSDCTGLTSVVIPNSVTTIGDYAFNGCAGLHSLIIGIGVLSIGTKAIGYIKYSEGIPNPVEKIIWLTNTPPKGYRNVNAMANYVANNLYSELSNINEYKHLSSIFEVGGIRYVPVSPSERTCDAIDCTYAPEHNKITLNKTVSYKGVSMTLKEIKPYLCHGNTTITKVIVDYDGNLASHAFSGCSAITSADITAKYIGDSAFSGSSTKNAATYKICANAIGDYAFSNCSAITRADITATSIGSNAFSSSSTKNVAKFKICAYAIGDHAFSGCSKMTKLTLDETLTKIGTGAFAYCSLLEGVTIPSSVNSIGYEAFIGCSALSYANIGSKLKAIPQGMFSLCSSLPSITIPKNVTKIVDYAFDGCTSLADVYIEDREDELSLGSNGSSPLFSDCPLKTVYIGGNISYPTSSSYGYSPFYRNTSLEKVIITDKETEISDNEFYGCTGLKYITMGDGIEKIGDWAFSGCSSLDFFRVGSNVKTIGKEAFSDCTAMTKLITTAPVPPTCGSQALDDINKWTCELFVNKESIDQYKAAEQWKEFFFISEYDGVDDVSVDTPDALYEVYNLQGVRVGSGMREAEVTADTLPHGVYILVSPQGRKKLKI